MKNKNTGRAMAVLALAAFFAASCQQFFTSSIAKPLARSNYSIPANIGADDAAALLAESGGDPKIAAALVKPLYNAIKNASPGTENYNTVANALLEAAVASSGINSVIAEAQSLFFSGAEDFGSILEKLDSISLSDDAVKGLGLVAQNFPANMNPDNAIAAAAALVVVACANEGSTISKLIDTGDPGHSVLINNLKDTPEITAALSLIDEAKNASVPSVFADLLKDLPNLE
ncbi:hypothetical protein MASR2M29_10050 [Spirochaetota bacterium]